MRIGYKNRWFTSKTCGFRVKHSQQHSDITPSKKMSILHRPPNHQICWIGRLPIQARQFHVCTLDVGLRTKSFLSMFRIHYSVDSMIRSRVQRSRNVRFLRRLLHMKASSEIWNRCDPTAALVTIVVDCSSTTG
jgi:hypothetical protein